MYLSGCMGVSVSEFKSEDPWVRIPLVVVVVGKG